ncbi:hypothetical protein HOY82DRAFT_176845 [Tuber indicum]|nr:hypothetical protein HOY82DRAFT_176845 [Tuber indicum]
MTVTNHLPPHQPCTARAFTNPHSQPLSLHPSLPTTENTLNKNTRTIYRPPPQPANRPTTTLPERNFSSMIHTVRSPSKHKPCASHTERSPPIPTPHLPLFTARYPIPPHHTPHSSHPIHPSTHQPISSFTHSFIHPRSQAGENYLPTPTFTHTYTYISATWWQFTAGGRRRGGMISFARFCPYIGT